MSWMPEINSDVCRKDNNNILNNLLSGQDGKRLSACIMLANIFGNEVVSNSLYDKILTLELLNGLCLRLSDSNKSVKLHATGAVR